MQAKAPARRRNVLLDHLSDRDFALLEPKLRPVELTFRQQLQQTGRRVNAAYFLESGIASVVVIGNGSREQAEAGVIGREGMTGLALVHGESRSPWDIFIQVEGHGQCIDADELRTALDQSMSLLRTLMRFAFVFSIQTAHTALANARGTLDARLARWLLMSQDRIEAPDMLLTHEFMALMLGVRRAGVTSAVQDFEAKGLIKHARGSVTIIDRDGLIEAANGFYGAPEAEAERLFSGIRQD